jgi:hypothetical protein
MQNSPWQIQDHVARLTTEQISAGIDSLNPAGGATVTSAGNVALSDITLFRVGLPALSPSPLTGEGRGEAEALPSAIAQSPMSPVEFFARGKDLIAIYSERPDRPFRAQICWRLIGSQYGGESLVELPHVAALELILSIQTSLLDSDPAVEVETELAARQASQLADTASARFNDVPTLVTATMLSPDTGAGCFRFPLAGRQLVYIEMIHPADFHRATLAPRGTNPMAIGLAHRLFPQRLEKGVILRSRLRGFFAPAEVANSAVARAYQEFAASEPPLTT